MNVAIMTRIIASIEIYHGIQSTIIILFLCDLSHKRIFLTFGTLFFKMKEAKGHCYLLGILFMSCAEK